MQIKKMSSEEVQVQQEEQVQAPPSSLQDIAQLPIGTLQEQFKKLGSIPTELRFAAWKVCSIKSTPNNI